ncbi:MAG: hypothetical protein RLZZ70_342 [Candidatus Parcubacteria bacterium]
MFFNLSSRERFWLLCDPALLVTQVRQASLFAGGQESARELPEFLSAFRVSAKTHTKLGDVWRRVHGTDP